MAKTHSPARLEAVLNSSRFLAKALELTNDPNLSDGSDEAGEARGKGEGHFALLASRFRREVNCYRSVRALEFTRVTRRPVQLWREAGEG